MLAWSIPAICVGLLSWGLICSSAVTGGPGMEGTATGQTVLETSCSARESEQDEAIGAMFV